MTESDAERVFKTAVTRTLYQRGPITVTEGDSRNHVVLEQRGKERTHCLRPDVDGTLTRQLEAGAPSGRGRQD